RISVPCSSIVPRRISVGLVPHPTALSSSSVGAAQHRIHWGISPARSAIAFVDFQKLPIGQARLVPQRPRPGRSSGRFVRPRHPAAPPSARLEPCHRPPLFFG